MFCVDQEHADEMRRAIVNLNSDLVQQHSDFACRVTADEGDIGRGHMAKFQDVETKTPVILTTSQLLTTGLNAPTCKNVVLARVISSMTEFKQIIGRGTRVRDDYGKLWFNIIDYTGSATRLFADPDFDGEPALISETEVDSEGEAIEEEIVEQQETNPEIDDETAIISERTEPERHKYYFDEGQVEIAAHLVYELDPEGRQLRVVRFTDYAGEKVRTLFPSAPALHDAWVDAEKRREIIDRLAERGIDFDQLAAAANQPDADPFDLLCHLAYNAPLRTRRERAERLRNNRKDFFEQYGSEARVILDELLEKYAEHGIAQFVLPDVLRLPPISDHGQPGEIIRTFGGADHLRQALMDLQTLLYAA